MTVFGRLMVRRAYVHYFNGSGILTFVPSTNHAAVTGYTVNVYTYGTTTLAASRSIGVPTPDTYGEIRHDCRAMFTPLSSGNYTMKVAAAFSSGTFESTAGDDFSLPLT